MPAIRTHSRLRPARGASRLSIALLAAALLPPCPARAACGDALAAAGSGANVLPVRAHGECFDLALPERLVNVRIGTELGVVVAELDARRAPATTANFLRYVDEGRFDGATFYRTVTPDNQPDNDLRIEVIQAGLGFSESALRLPPILHETTRASGLRHVDGAISMARLEPGTASSEFFVCVGDQPELDFGGARNPDGQGFAAFGRVVDGMDVVRAIQARPADGQMLVEPVAITAIEREASGSGSDPRAVRLAESVLERMGGRDAWDATQFLQWRFSGKRLHLWDKWTGDVRIEADSTVVLMNVNDRTGRVFRNGVEIPDGDELREALELGYAWWVNDSYWLVMPYKLLDPGVRLAYGGDSALEDGRPAKKMTMEFDGVGLTPDNRYDVWVAENSGLVEQWAFFRSAGDPDPVFVGPWSGWERFGEILLPTERGRGADWEIAVPDSVPAARFTSP